MTMTIIEALSVYGRVRNGADDLAWTLPWRRRRRNRFRFEASRLLGKVALVDCHAEIVISAWSGSPLETAYRELEVELKREREVHQD